MQALNVRISGIPDPVVVKVPDMGYIRGRDGKNGEDGFSPTVDVEDVEGGHEVTITDKEGEHSFFVKDGGAGTFVAVYGTTTLEELDEAFDAGKTIIAVEDIPFGLLAYYTLAKRDKYMPIGGEALVNKYTFVTCAIYDNNWIYVCECKADGWTQRTIDVATEDYVRLNAVWNYQGEENAGKLLAVGNDGDITLIPNTSGTSTFVAVYGTTTLAELDEAFDAGKNIIVVRDIPFDLLVYYTLARRYKYVPQGEENAVNAYSFATCYGDNALYTCECKADGWTENTIWVATYEYVALNAVLQYQGRGNAGKALVVGPDGKVVPADPPGSVRKGTISLSAQWDGDGLYTQTVTVPGIPVTANSKVDLQPDMEEIEQLAGDGVAALYVENDNGVLTAYAAGAAPSSAMTLQCTVTEVRV
jgi:hypothetical protein